MRSGARRESSFGADVLCAMRERLILIRTACDRQHELGESVRLIHDLPDGEATPSPDIVSAVDERGRLVKNLGIALIAMAVLSTPAAAAPPRAGVSVSAVTPTTALATLALFMNDPSVEGLAISAVGSAAYVYLDSARLIAANDALDLFDDDSSFQVDGDRLVDADGFTLSDLVLAPRD